ncbi:o-succinylbenzoate synthase [Arthrobacter yangruifuii]|uniref:o-succinylbenzoate synthase n=1 Tax=Arthrobacter yangruifuii TaxID=2606616 RepID=UPI0011B5B2B6|nr:o-succinylbenzoate synthase [Arthrobacter yangruifuii]
MSPDLSVLLANARVVSIPMRVKFRGILHREALLLSGPAGWGEFAPFPEYSDAEAVPWLASALEASWEGYPDPVRSSVPVNGTVPAVPVSEVEAVLARFGNVSAVKVKVAEAGQSPQEDLARVAEVRRLLPDAGIRVDANEGWDVSTAVDTLTALAGAGLEYAEQPVAGIAGLRAVRTELRRRGVPVLIAADESVRKESDPLKVAREDAADLIVVKAAPLGGVRRALEIVAQAGLPAVVSSAIDTSVGIRTGVALAAALPELPYACGLGTLSLMAGDVTGDSLVPDGGALAVRDVPVSGELLERFAASPERTRWWLDRLERVHGLPAERPQG